MTKIPATNYTDNGCDFLKPDNDNDQFDREDVQKMGEALDTHDHKLGRGLPITRVQGGLKADRPVGEANEVYFATDEGTCYFHNGSAWITITPGANSVTSAMIKDGEIRDADIASDAAIAQSKISNASRAIDAHKVDGCDAGNGAGNVLKLDASGKVPLANIPVEAITPPATVVQSSISGLKVLMGSTTVPAKGSFIDISFGGLFTQAPYFRANRSGPLRTELATKDGYHDYDDSLQDGEGSSGYPYTFKWIAIGV